MDERDKYKRLEDLLLQKMIDNWISIVHKIKPVKNHCYVIESHLDSNLFKAQLNCYIKLDKPIKNPKLCNGQKINYMELVIKNIIETRPYDTPQCAIYMITDIYNIQQAISLMDNILPRWAIDSFTIIDFKKRCIKIK